MNAMTADERGDLAEAMLPEAAAMAVSVREETQEQIASRLAGLSRHELEAMVVVMAALVDPDRSLKDALGWVNFDEYGEPLPKPCHTVRTVRGLIKEGVSSRAAGVDRVAVERALAGDWQDLNTPERSLGVDLGIRRGMTYDDVAERLGMERDTVKQAWTRAKRTARLNGRHVPTAHVGQFVAA